MVDYNNETIEKIISYVKNYSSIVTEILGKFNYSKSEAKQIFTKLVISYYTNPILKKDSKKRLEDIVNESLSFNNINETFNLIQDKGCSLEETKQTIMDVPELLLLLEKIFKIALIFKGKDYYGLVIFNGNEKQTYIYDRKHIEDINNVISKENGNFKYLETIDKDTIRDSNIKNNIYKEIILSNDYQNNIMNNDYLKSEANIDNIKEHLNLENEKLYNDSLNRKDHIVLKLVANAKKRKDIMLIAGIKETDDFETVLEKLKNVSSDTKNYHLK